MARQIISSKQSTIAVVERIVLTPAPGTAAPRHEYRTLFTVRASVRVASGTSEFAQVDINGKRVTHTFSIRWVSIPFDTRHRVRGVLGDLYQILNVINVDDDNRELRIQCASMGSEDREAAR